MTATYEPIATSTLGSAGEITFSSIPSTYSDLKVVLVCRAASTSYNSQQLNIRYNSDLSTNFSYVRVTGDGSTASYTSGTSQNRIFVADAVPGAADVWGIVIVDIVDYSGSQRKTSLISVAGDRNGSGIVASQAALWRSTSAISTIRLFPDIENFGTGTTATLFGITRE